MQPPSCKHAGMATTIIDDKVNSRARATEKQREQEKKRRKEKERERVRGRGIARYTWIIDFVHERATAGASKIPVALLIVVNCLLYTTSFQMRFRRSPPSGG